MVKKERTVIAHYVTEVNFDSTKHLVLLPSLTSQNNPLQQADFFIFSSGYNSFCKNFYWILPCTRDSCV